jgi:hypothetical protein
MKNVPEGRYYILDADNHIVPADLVTWAMWLDNNNKTLGYTEITSACMVSTVFLGLDHGWRDGPPILFETMIFGGPLDESQWRYSSYDDAMVGHTMAVKKARTAIGQKVTP